MPKVGKKEFSYSDKGKAKAEAYAEKTGQNIEKGSSPMAYEVNDARNRSETYKEGGKVEVNEYKEGGKVLSIREEEENKREREHMAMLKRQRARRTKKKKDIVLSKEDKADLARSRKRISQKAKHAVGKKQKGYDPGDIDITDITRNVEQVEKMKSAMKYREVVKQEEADSRKRDDAWRKKNKKKK